MKVRLFTLAAIAATTLLSQGVAQSDSLERALADLNSGLVAPAGNAGVTWGGDFRIRNNWDDDGTNTNNRDLDTRVRLTAAFNITEDSSAFVGFNGSESWGSGPNMVSGGVSTDSNGDTTHLADVQDGWTSGAQSPTAVDRAYVTVNNLMGDGGSMKAGRDYYTFGSGRILGSDDWQNNPSAQSGVWYSHDMGGMNMNFAMLNGTETGNNEADDGDDMIYALSMDYALDTGVLGTINMTPYAVRAEADDSQNWKGAALAGSIMGFAYDAEYAKYDTHEGDDSSSAWAISTSIDLDVLASIPGITNGGVDISVSSADEGFQTLGATTYGVGGFSSNDIQAWNGETDITSIGLNFSPAEGWDGRLASHDVDGVRKELDLSVGHDFNGNVAGWFGYAMVDPEGDASDDTVTFWTTLSVSF